MNDRAGTMNDSFWNEVNTPGPESVRHLGVELRVGHQVRLWPKRGADILDLVLAGKVATIAALEQDFENRVHVAVVIDDDPGKDLGTGRFPGHRFFFNLEEVEPMSLPDNGFGNGEFGKAHSGDGSSRDEPE
jgi:hypothetical protein